MATIQETYHAGVCYLSGTEGYPLNYSKAYQCFYECAKQGNSDAMNQIGTIYEHGKGVAPSAQIAVDWYYKALQTDSKNIYAAYNLACMYYYGKGVPKDVQKAYQFCKNAAILGARNPNAVYAQCCHLTGSIIYEHFKNNRKEAVDYFIAAAKYGDFAESWYMLGVMTMEGYVPYKISQSEKLTSAGREGAKLRAVIEYYEYAAKKKYAPAIHALGCIYNLHLHQEQKAFECFQKAANMGYEPSKKMIQIKTGNTVEQAKALWSLFSKR